MLRRLAEVGTLVGTLTPLPVVTVADLSQLEIRAEVDEADVAAIKLGKAAYATADAFGDKQFPIHVTRITRELGRKTVRDDDPRAPRRHPRARGDRARSTRRPATRCRSACACTSTSTASATIAG